MPRAWILYGTRGCHLCESAAYLLQQFAAARFVDWQYQDIIDLKIEETARFSSLIPILKINQLEHPWPFSLAELSQWQQELYQTENLKA